MRAIWSVLALLALAGQTLAQEKPAEGGKPEVGKADEKGAPKAAEAWSLPEKEAKKLAGLLRNYFDPKKKDVRKSSLEKIQKFVSKEIDGHSALEDVGAIVQMANQLRRFNPKLASKKGKVQTVAIAPETHGFPGGIGTVRYHLYLPKGYSEKKRWPLLFCLPDNKRWTDGEKYIEEAWVKRSPEIANGWIVAVPVPQSKGEDWTRPKSHARAMIALRHVSGTWDATKKNGGPATDMLRMFIDGQSAAALVAARFPEMFRGAILHQTDGKAAKGPNVRTNGQLSNLAAYVIYDGTEKRQLQFGEKLKADNDESVLATVENAGPLGNASVIEAWMTKLGSRTGQPTDIRYVVQDASFQRHYWINILEFDASTKPDPMVTATADRAKNEIKIDVLGISRFELYLNDALVDLSKKVRIVVVENEKELEFSNDMVARDVTRTLDELVDSNHPWRVYSYRFIVDVPDLRVKVAKLEAEKAAKAQKKKGAPGKPTGAKKDKPTGAKKKK